MIDWYAHWLSVRDFARAKGYKDMETNAEKQLNILDQLKEVR